ncbi:endo-1,4-beta-xylanase [Catellatospora coxensis]
MKRLAVALAATLIGSLLVAPGPAAAAAESLKTLAAASRGGTGPLIGSAMRHSAMGDDAYTQRAAQEFSLIAPESEFVWGSVNRGADPANPYHGVYGFDRLDPVVDFARTNNQTIIGQHLAWHTDIPVYDAGAARFACTSTAGCSRRGQV